ncbi:MAG: P-loop NTPase [Spirochaetia bacterium]|jgi:flagellar biosynthesis protein FlhG
MVILPIGSGKGGVGKSLLATNLSIALAEAGRKVALADLDLGASNAHTMLGIRAVSRGIGTFLSVPHTRFDQVVLDTEYRGLSFIPGDAEVPGIAILKAAQKKRLIRCLESLAVDFLVLDLGPGSGANALDFFLLSPGGILVTTPALTSILNAYLFLKNAVFRLMYAAVDRQSRAFAVLEETRKEGGAGLQRTFVPRILERISREDPQSHARLTDLIGGMRPRLVLNMVEDPSDADKGEKLRRSAREYLGVEVAHLGVIFRDELQAVALGSRIPILRYKPGSVLSRAVYRIAEKLLSARPDETGAAQWRAGAAAGGEAEDGYPAVEAEAEADFKDMRRDLEDLLHSGALTMADLVESVRTQQVELATLRRENAQLRARLQRGALREGSRT